MAKDITKSLARDIDLMLTFKHVPDSDDLWNPTPVPELIRQPWPKKPRMPTFDEAARMLRAKLLDATKEHLRGQQKAIVALSGGIDSAVTAFLLRQYLDPDDIRVVTLDYGDAPGLEDKAEDLRLASVVADVLGIKARHHIVRVNPQTVQDLLPEIAWRLTNPYCGVISAAFLNDILRGCSEVWTGDWGDELYGSYKGPREVFDVQGNMRDIYQWRYRLYQMSDGQKVGYYSSRMKGMVPYGYAQRAYTWWGSPGHDPVEAMLRVDWASLLPHQVLWSTMVLLNADSVSPHQWVTDFVWSLPTEYRIIRGRTKRLLRAAFANDLPKEIVERGAEGRKTGFVQPSHYWMRNYWKSEVMEAINRLDGAGLFDVAAIRETVKFFMETGQEWAGDHVWAFYMLSLWLEAHDYI